MPDPYPANDADLPRQAKTPNKSLLDRLLSLVRREPEDREGIKAILEAAHERELLDAESYAMIKGALAVSERTVGDIMVPRSRMDLLDIAQPLPQLLSSIIDTAHSRFPVFEEDRDNIIGILLAKDLLRGMLEPDIEVRSLVRPAVFIPESKRLNILLHDFRESRNHLAIVIDEHGGIAGLITMEDVLEEIVGDIEDEFDEDDEATVFAEGDNQWRVLATTDIDKFNDTFGVSLPDDEYDSIGGWLGGELGRIPRRGDCAERDGLRFEVVRADPRRALWLRVKRLAPEAPQAPPGA
jgi:magnesium and cobalt transporter